MKKKQKQQPVLGATDASNTKLFDNISQYLDKERTERNYENLTVLHNDLTELVHQLAVFSKRDYKIYKLNVIDYTGQRFECSGNKLTKWLSFNEGTLFNFMNEEQFQHYYNIHCEYYDRPYDAEMIKEWLKVSRMRIGRMSDNSDTEPVMKD